MSSSKEEGAFLVDATETEMLKGIRLRRPLAAIVQAAEVHHGQVVGCTQYFKSSIFF